MPISRRLTTIALLAAALLSVLRAGAHEADLKPLGSGSLAAMLKVRTGQPFMLVLWSVTCEPCRRQFGLLRDLSRQKPRVPLVLVSTDDASLAGSATRMLEEYGLEHEDVWIFSGPDPVRLRREIDPTWDGRLPRTYLYDASHARQVINGPLDPARTDGWVRQVTAEH